MTGSAWTRVPSPDVDTITELNGVVALSSTNAWAVGYASNQGAVVMHFDGHSWTATTLPQLSSLTAITALSASDLWAAGLDPTGDATLANSHGSGWTITPAPAQPGQGSPSLTALTATSPATVLGAGSVWDGTTGTGRPMTIRTTDG